MDQVIDHVWLSHPNATVDNLQGLSIKFRDDLETKLGGPDWVDRLGWTDSGGSARVDQLGWAKCWRISGAGGNCEGNTSKFGIVT